MMKRIRRKIPAAVRSRGASRAAALRLGERSILNGLSVLAAVYQKATVAKSTATTLITSRLMPAVRAHAQRLKAPGTSVLDLHPSGVAPAQLRWRQHVRDLVIELGFAPDPGEWMFYADQQGQWGWKYVVSRAVVARSSSFFSDFSLCLRDAREHGFSSVFGFYSAYHDVPSAGT